MGAKAIVTGRGLLSSHVSQHGDARPWIVPVGWALLITSILAIGLRSVSWPFGDLYYFLYQATTLSWRETLVRAFGGSVEYRPLLIIGVKLAHQLVGLRLWVYQTLIVLQFAAILGCLLWLFRPPTKTRTIAACIALACVAGLHTSRVLLMFMPLNAHSFGLLLILVATALALLPRSALVEWAFFPFTLMALLIQESGILIVPVLLVLWKMGAPGATRRAVAAVLAASAVYLAIRLGLGAQKAVSTYAETGLGFADVSAERLAEIFANAPWLFWIYNVVASVLTLLVSEPRAGKYRFIEALLHGRVPVWMYVHVVTSLLTTAIVVYGLTTSRITNIRDRYVAAAGVTLLVVGSALGFLYTRDRIGLFAGTGYAMLVYVAISSVLEARVGTPRIRMATTVALVLIGAGWVTRTAEAYFQQRDAALENRLEWTTRYEELGGFRRPQTDLLVMLRKAALERVPADPRSDPPWTYVLFERKFERVPPP
jgi:hypothetical protein